MKNEEKKQPFNPLFTVDLVELKRGDVLVERDIPLKWLENELVHCEYEAVPRLASVNLTASSCSGGVLVRGDMKALIASKCGSCLADVSINLNSSLNTYMFPKVALDEDSDDELTPEDLEKEWFEGETIVLDGLVRDSLMLEMPMNPKCAKLCKGLADFESGADEKAIDSRFAALANFDLNKEK